jgi:predicted  nucleic acid-binding Zn ribbon protein
MPFTDHSVFVPRPMMDDALAQRSSQQQQLKQEEQDSSCSAFKAATEVVRKSSHCDITGVASFLCRHGFVMRAATMSTSENFTYYEVQLEDILRAYSKEGRQLCFVFVDVACRMGPMLGR